MKQSALYLLFVLILFASCAQKVAPEGGIRDTESPKIVASDPKNFSTDFKEQKIKLVFSEYVQLRSIQNQFIISPPVNELPKFKLNGKTLTVTFVDTLKENTTYNLNFGNAIGDLTENNILDSNIFVFSTGKLLDSLRITGTVKDAFSLAPEKDIWVMLYKETHDDSIVTKKKPYYFTKTNEQGQYELNYLAQGNYKIFALSDKNSNYLFDLPNEKIGFHSDLVTPNDSGKMELLLFLEDREKQFIKKHSYENNQLTIVFNLPNKIPKITPLNANLENEWYIEELSQKQDSAMYWVTLPEDQDSLILQVLDGETVIDTLEINLHQPDKKVPSPFIALTTNVSSNFLHLFDSLRISFKTPVVAINKDSIQLMESESIIPFTIASKESTKRNFSLTHSWKEDTEYTLTIFPGAFKDLYNKTHDTVNVTFKTGFWDQYGAMTININTSSEEKYILELLNEQNAILKTVYIKNKTNLKFNHLLPAKYKLKLILDSDNNQQWSTGNYFEKKQPEKVLFYPELIQIRRGFESDIKWNLDVETSQE